METLFKWRLLLIVYIFLNNVEQTFASVHIRGVMGGVNKETGERPARRDITELQSSGPAFDLYVLALKEFQEDDRDDILSYYKVAGIHGYPYVSWDGVEGTEEAGYCSHGSTLFPLWHRPYLALFEEIIWEKAQRIAVSFPESQRSEYESAAKTLRIPYWDWASNPEMPECTVTREIEITTRFGREIIQNPLYSYELNPTAEDGFPRWSMMTSYSETVRSPDRNGQSQMEKTQNALRSIGSALRINTYELLTSETNYTVFSTASLAERGENYNSLEAIHDAVHDTTGGYAGHMTYIPWASYDPIFWLHHAQLDRLTALWQILNPDSYVQPYPNHSGDFVKAPGTIEDIDTPLTPFHRADGEFHTAETARTIKAFGYTYPEIQDWDVEPEELQKRVRQQINDLYNRPGDQGPQHGKRSLSQHQRGQMHEKRGLLPLNLDNVVSDILDEAFNLVEAIGDLGKTSLERFLELAINNLERQYVVNVKVDKSAHPIPFKVYFFLSQPPANPALWGTASNLIGCVGGYSTTGTMKMSGASDTHILYSQIPLSHALATLRAQGLIDSLESETVVPILKKHLEWRVVTLEGEVIDTKEFVGKGNGREALEVRVSGRDVCALELDELSRVDFPGFGAWEVYEEVTKEKIGGYKERI